MKNLLYIGNKLSQNNKTVTTIETLGKGLEALNYNVVYASSKTNMVLRFLDMIAMLLKHRNTRDYVLIDTYSTLNFYYALAISQLCRVFSLKYIPILHGGNLPNRLKANPKLSQAIFKNAYKNVAPSNYTKSAFENYGFTNTICIPNAINLDNYPKIEKTYHSIDLLWVRSFSELYNPKLAVTVLKLLLDKGYKTSLTMVGPDNDGSLLATKQYAKDLNLEVNFTGKLSKSDWISLSKSSNYFINTTNFDNMPVSVIEAMALGFPIVSTNVGGIPFLVENNKDAILVKPDNAEIFAEALIYLHTNEAKREALVLNALKKAKNFDWLEASKLWQNLLS